MARLQSISPIDYQLIGEVDISTPNEIKEKVAMAHKAEEGWRELGMHKRVELLQEVYDAFEKRKEEITNVVVKEMGFSVSQQIAYDLGDGFNYFKWYLDNVEKYLSPEVTLEEENAIHTVYYEPIGVAGVIVPWNFPFCNWSWAVVPLLLAGNTVVFKHSEEVPLSGKLIEEIIASCHLPEGVFSEVYGGGEVGDTLVHEDINLISFTGSTKVGQYLYKVAGEKFIKTLMELGGSAPGVIFEDADIPTVIEGVFAQRFSNNGQACDGLKRLLVHESIFDAVVAGLKKKIEATKLGNPQNEKTDFGPLVARRQVDLLQEQIDDAVEKGAKVVVGGKSPEGMQGAYYEPTLLTNVTKDMRVWQEEVFGPALPIVSFKTEDEAIMIANDTKYGLGSYIYTKDKEKAKRVALKIKTGMVSVNGLNYVIPSNPFGGNKMSGMGREHGKYGLHEITSVKVVVTEK